MPSYGLCGHCVHVMNIQTHRQTLKHIKQKNLKEEQTLDGSAYYTVLFHLVIVLCLKNQCQDYPFLCLKFALFLKIM